MRNGRVRFYAFTKIQCEILRKLLLLVQQKQRHVGGRDTTELGFKELLRLHKNTPFFKKV